MINDYFKRLYQSDTGTIFLFSLCSWLQALQCLFLIVVAASFFNIDTTTLSHIFTSRFAEVHVEREVTFFRIYVILAFFIQAAGLWLFRDKLASQDFRSTLKFLISLDIVWVVLEIFLAFKIVVYQNPAWARGSLYTALALMVVSKVFLPELRTRALPVVRAMGRKFLCAPPLAADILFIALIVLLLWVPDLERVVAATFMQDSFRQFDAALMSPGWAYLNGGILNVDQISPLGSLAAPIVAILSKLTGAFDYIHAVGVLIALTVLYYFLVYVFLKTWLKSRSLAAAGTLLAIKLQVYGTGVAPMAWMYPSSTVLRHLWDAAVFILLVRNLERPSVKLLAGAASLCGLALAFAVDSGLYLLGAFYLYLFLFEKKNDYEALRCLAVLALAPWLAAGLVLLIMSGPALWSHVYWAHVNEAFDQYFNGFGAAPVWAGLRGRQFFAFFMGLAIPVIYLLTMLIVGITARAQVMGREKLFVVVVCVYGLLSYQDFVVHSQPGQYYVLGVAFVMVIAFWMKALLTCVEPALRQRTSLIIAAGVLVTFLSNPWFTLYPNILNLARYDWAKEKEAYRQQFHFEADTALIKKLTAASEPVALLSSFETKILIDADRKPFFYDFPLLQSSAMPLNFFGGTRVFTQVRLQRTLDRLQTQPALVFVERKLWAGQIAPEYFKYYQSLDILVKYLRTHYEVDQEGGFLTALKLKVKR